MDVGTVTPVISFWTPVALFWIFTGIWEQKWDKIMLFR